MENLAVKSELAQLAQQFFEYRDGELIRLKTGTRAGTLRSDGYRHIRLNGKRYFEHRLIYLMFNPDWDITDTSQQIDHINQIKDDNRIENLRVVTNQENQFNTNARGYGWDKQTQKWMSYIDVNGKHKTLGRFDYKTDARLAHVTAKKDLHIIEDRK